MLFQPLKPRVGYLGGQQMQVKPAMPATPRPPTVPGTVGPLAAAGPVGPPRPPWLGGGFGPAGREGPVAPALTPASKGPPAPPWAQARTGMTPAAPTNILGNVGTADRGQYITQRGQLNGPTAGATPYLGAGPGGPPRPPWLNASPRLPSSGLSRTNRPAPPPGGYWRGGTGLPTTGQNALGAQGAFGPSQTPTPAAPVAGAAGNAASAVVQNTPGGTMNTQAAAPDAQTARSQYGNSWAQTAQAMRAGANVDLSNASEADLRALIYERDRSTGYQSPSGPAAEQHYRAEMDRLRRGGKLFEPRGPAGLRR